MATDKKLEDLDMTPDEIKRISEALKKEEFRKLLVEYAQEISDPENKARYEAEIAQMEAEKGMDVTFIHPKPGYVIKTSCNGETKAFINICENEHIEKPSSKREKDPSGKFGLNWSVPHSFAPPRDDYDKKKVSCKVFDVVYHPDTLRMATSNQAFKNMVNNIALEGIEKQFGVKLDKKNLRFPKINFKGTAQATVVRKKKAGEKPKPVDPDDPLSKCPYPYDERTTEEKSRDHSAEMEKKRQEQEAKARKTVRNSDIKEEESGYALPNYSIVYRSDMDMLNYMNTRDSSPGTRPTQIVITVELPMLKSSKVVNLDIYEKRVVLSSETPARYRLDLDLPYLVNEEQGSAKFDKSKRTLAITLPVVKEDVNSNTVGKSDERTSCAEADDNLSDAKPVIEVLASGDSESVPKLVTRDDDLKPVPKSEIPYNKPVYDFHQNEKSLTFIFVVKNVDDCSIRQRVLSDGSAYDIKFASVGSGGYPVHYSFCAKFQDGCTLAQDGCSVDVSSQNVVVILPKSEKATWHKFLAGLDEHDLEEKEFMTQANIMEDLKAAVEGQAEPSQSKAAPHVEVTKFDEEGVTVSIQPAKPLETAEAEEESDELSDTSVEVIHNKTPPKLQSILKQKSRTISESSDDLGHSLNAENSLSYSSNGQGGSDCTISESDENGEFPKLRRSVSFSSHTDTVTYKSNASVSTMKNTLKNKRRRQKKREQKEHSRQERRRRHSSTGSECSSGDEVHGARTGKLASLLAGGNNTNKVEDREESAQEAVDIHGEADNSGAQVNGIVGSSDIDSSMQSTEAEDQESQDTISNSSCIVNGESGQKYDNIISSSPRTSPRGQKIREETNAAIAKIASIRESELNSDDEEAPIENGANNSLIEELTEPNGVAPSLSWEDKPVQLDQMNHKTQCAFEFDNTVMFDLD